MRGCRSWSRSDTLSSIAVLHRTLVGGRARPEALRGRADLRLEVLVGPKVLSRNDRLRSKLGLEGRISTHRLGSGRLVDRKLPPGKVETRGKRNDGPAVFGTSTAQSLSSDEGGIPNHVNRRCVETDNDTLEGKRNPANRSVLHHDDPVTDGKGLPLQAVDCVRRLEQSLPWYSLN